MPADAPRLLCDLRALAKLTSTDHGAQRLAWTPAWEKAREWERSLLGEIPARLETDEAANQWAVLEGESPDALIIGSHIDSVPDGGWLDGCLGVLSGIAVLRRIAAEGRPPLTVKLVDWADEEGARFGLSLIGSSAAAGTLDPEFVRGLRDVHGVCAGDVLGEHGVELGRMLEARRGLERAIAYVELHIEQGPVLEARGLPLSVVTGTYGTERWAVRFTGQTAHAGSTPMNQRRDALAAAARFALEVRTLAHSHGGVGTVGRIDIDPGIPSAVAGVATAVVDQRHSNAKALSSAHEDARRASERIAREEGVDVTWSPLLRLEPASFDRSLIDLASGIVTGIQGVEMQLPSGPMHDATRMVAAGVPTVMLFVRSKLGLSHTREEDSDEADIALALRALDQLVTEILDQSYMRR